MLTKGEKKVIWSLWHSGIVRPDGGFILMVNTTNTCVGQYIPETNKVRNWYGVGKYVEVSFTPKCHWAYLNDLRGKDRYRYNELTQKCEKV